jgi:hypothetical protein
MLSTQASSAEPPVIERWRCPAVLRVKSAVMAAAGVAVAVVFFPLWFAIPAAAACAAWGLGMAAAGSSATIYRSAGDRSAGLLVLRMGLIARRIRLTDVSAVAVEKSKVSVARAGGAEVSLYAWRKGMTDRLLGVPDVAGDVGHAISRAVALAQVPKSATVTDRRAAGRTPAGTRSRLASAALAGAGAVGIVGALVIRVHWHNPALTIVSVILALLLGISGLAYLVVATWILVTGRAPRIPVGQ